MATCEQKLKEAREQLRVMRRNYEFQRGVSVRLRKELAELRNELASYDLPNRMN